jgi:N-methylhydantoinase A
LPEYREYERTATTVINAYVQPLVARYLARLAQTLATELPGARPAVHIMQSNGGVIGLEQAAAQAARVVLSGPAGGAVGAFAVATQAMRTMSPDLPFSLSEDNAINLITFDMGGTSTDVALCPGHIPTTAESTITDLPLRLPVIDIHTVGAGGGSIAFVDAGGALAGGAAQRRRGAGASLLWAWRRPADRDRRQPGIGAARCRGLFRRARPSDNR